MHQLYRYQQAVVDGLRREFAAGHRGVVACVPTGGGKTVIAGHIIQSLDARGKRCMVLVHKDFLARQFYEVLSQAGCAARTGLIAAGAPESPWLPHHVAMVQSMVRRLKHNRIAPPDLIIIDECHHASAATWRRILEHWPSSRLLGLSATPQRPDGKGLQDLFQAIVCGPGTADLISRHRLSPFECWGVQTGFSGKGAAVRRGDYDAHALHDAIMGGEVMARIASQVQRFGPGRRSLAFLPSVQSSEDLVGQLCAAGLRWVHVDGKTPKPTLRASLRGLADGSLDGVSSVDLLIEGVDVPEADCAFLARPTKSHVIYLQQVGRVLRWREGKTARIVDCCATLQEHGAPDAEREWSLYGNISARGERARKPQLTKCGSCSALCSPSAVKCPSCGRVFERVGKPLPDEVDVDLVKLEGVTIRRRENGARVGADVNRAARLAWKAGGREALLKLADSLGYKPAWADHQAQMRRGRQ